MRRSRISTSSRGALAAWVTVGLAFASDAHAQGQPPARSQAPGAESFAKKPETPLELWGAVDYLVRVGQAEQALPYLKAFLDSKPDDATLLQIRDRYGPGSIMRLYDHPETQAQARPLMDMVAAASRRHATQPERIRSAIAALTKTREEQRYGVEQLRHAGPYAVPYVIEELRRTDLPRDERGLLVANLGQLDRSAVPALLSVLDSSDPTLQADAAEALGQIGDRRAVPYLAYLAAKGEGSVQAAARRAIQRLTGRPPEGQPKPPVRTLADEARKYLAHAVPFPGDRVEIWEWNDGPKPRVVSRSEAEGILGLRFAREALELSPSDPEAQAVLLGLALQKEIEQVGVEQFPDNDPTGAFASALAAGPSTLGLVLRTALVDGNSEVAAAAATALGRVTDRSALTATGRPAPLVEALAAPDRRVQFAAVRALIGLDPQRPFPGSSRVVPVLARFVTTQPMTRAVVIDSNPNRGGQVVGFLKELGYDPMLALAGDQGFRLASSSAGVELIVIEPSLMDSSWKLVDTLANLRADASTAGIPIFISAPLNVHDQVRAKIQGFPRVGLLVAPANTQVLKPQLDRGLAQMGVRPLSQAEKARYAREAAGLLAGLASRPGNPFEADLPAAGPALVMALNDPATAPSAAVALADIPGVDAQRGLADLLLDPAKPAQLRLAAASQLSRSIQRFGRLVSAAQERRLVEELNRTPEPALRTALAATIGALQPQATSVGARLQTFTPGRPAPPPAPVPAPAPGATPAPIPDANAPEPEAGASAPAPDANAPAAEPAPASAPAPEGDASQPKS